MKRTITLEHLSVHPDCRRKTVDMTRTGGQNLPIVTRERGGRQESPRERIGVTASNPSFGQKNILGSARRKDRPVVKVGPHRVEVPPTNRVPRRGILGNFQERIQKKKKGHGRAGKRQKDGKGDKGILIGKKGTGETEEATGAGNEEVPRVLRAGGTRDLLNGRAPDLSRRHSEAEERGTGSFKKR